jgi:putative transposase
MKSSKFADYQIMDALKPAEAGFTFTDICRELGISKATFYKRHAKYDGVDAPMISGMISGMKELEDENRRPNKM